MIKIITPPEGCFYFDAQVIENLFEILFTKETGIVET